MGIEDRLGTRGRNRLVGTTRIIIGAAMISYSAMNIGIILKKEQSQEHKIQRESLYDNIQRNRKDNKSLSEKFFPKNKSMQSNSYNSRGMPPKEIIDAAESAGNILEDSIPYLIMIGGVLSLVSGAGYIKNPNYRK